MAYQPPLVAHKHKPGDRSSRTIIAGAVVYLMVAVSYSVGYGETMAAMASRSADAAYLLESQDYSAIPGMRGVFSPIVRLGVLDAVNFRPKSLMFGVFSGFWGRSADFELARSNAAVVHPEPTLDRAAVLRKLQAAGVTPESVRKGGISVETLRKAGVSAAMVEKLKKSGINGLSVDTLKKRDGTPLSPDEASTAREWANRLGLGQP